jgi:hypothetical protein
MKYNYYNPVSRQYGYIDKQAGKRSLYYAFYRDINGSKKFRANVSFGDADAVMVEHGYKRMGVIDESGCRRYTMTHTELQDLYKRFENFVADCTQQEYNENKAAITAVYTLIHKHLNAETMK